jgi:hypothetical protein
MPDTPDRRAMSSRVDHRNAQAAYTANVGQPGILSTYADMRHIKQYWSSYPTVPYWKKADVAVGASPSSNCDDASVMTPDGADDLREER